MAMWQQWRVMGVRRAGLACAMLAATASVLAIDSRAQGLRPGTEPRAVSAWPADRPPTLAPSAAASVAAAGDDDTVAERALTVAVETLQRGQRTAAQRQIEILVARYPETPAATRARALLLGIYGASAPAAAPPELARPAVTAQPVPNAPPAGARALQDDFRIVAGDRLFFGDGAADLGVGARAVIAAQARWLRRHATITVTIEAHGDERGGPADAMRLSAERGAAVRAGLIAEGVDALRITVTALGDRNRVALCTEPLCAAQNRRAVVAISGVIESVPGGVGDAARRQPDVARGRSGAGAAPPR